MTSFSPFTAVERKMSGAQTRNRSADCPTPPHHTSSHSPPALDNEAVVDYLITSNASVIEIRPICPAALELIERLFSYAREW